MPDGTYFYVEEIRTGRQVLAVKTLFKKKGGPPAMDASSPSGTPPPQRPEPSGSAARTSIANKGGGENTSVAISDAMLKDVLAEHRRFSKAKAGLDTDSAAYDAEVSKHVKNKEAIARKHGQEYGVDSPMAEFVKGGTQYLKGGTQY